MLEINMEFHRGILFVELVGSLNKKTVNIFKNKIIDIFDGISNIVYDLSKLNSIDNYGISVIHDSYNLCKHNDGTLYLCGNDDIKKEFETWRLYGRVNS